MLKSRHISFNSFRIALAIACISTLVFLLSSCNNDEYYHGKALYATYCSNCHMEDGRGLKRLIPGLNDENYLSTNFHKLPCIIKYGLEEEIEVNGKNYKESMPDHLQLTDVQIKHIINYFLTEFTELDQRITEEQVKESILACN